MPRRRSANLAAVSTVKRSAAIRCCKLIKRRPNELDIHHKLQSSILLTRRQRVRLPRRRLPAASAESSRMVQIRCRDPRAAHLRPSVTTHCRRGKQSEAKMKEGSQAGPGAEAQPCYRIFDWPSGESIICRVWPCLPSSAVPLLDAIDRHDNFLPNTTTGKTIFAFIYLFRKLSIQPFALPPFFLAFICALLSPIADVIQLSVSMATWQLFSAGDGRESNGLQRRHVQEGSHVNKAVAKQCAFRLAKH